MCVFGRSYDYASDWQGQNILAAQSLTFGEQMGWIKPEVYKELEYHIRTTGMKGEAYDGWPAGAHGNFFRDMGKRRGKKTSVVGQCLHTGDGTNIDHIFVPDGDYLLQGDLHGRACLGEERLIFLLPTHSGSWMLI